MLEVVFEQAGAGQLFPFLSCLILGSAIGYFGIEMLSKKTTRVFKKSCKGFCIYAGVLLILLVTLHFDVFWIERWRPETEQVSAVTVQFGREKATVFASPAQIDMVREWHGEVIADKGRIEKSSNYFGSTWFTLSYEIDGKTKNREYRINTEDQAAKQILSLLNTPEAILSRSAFQANFNEASAYFCYVSYRQPNSGWKEVPLSREEATRLYHNAILPDMQYGRIGALRFDGVNYGEFICKITLQLMVIEDGEYHKEIIEWNLVSGAKKTIAFLRDLDRGIEFPKNF
ncbi:MAG: hypothetical protein FWE69_06910, partial [Clostridiales bacterium]|nr:hypothetical protein [Clostridiales bacterium]